MDDFMQWAMNMLDHQQHAAAAPPSYGGGTGGTGAGVDSDGAAAFPSLQALRHQSTAAAGVRDPTVQVDHHRESSWSASASSGHSPGTAAMDREAAAAGWSPQTARARTIRPMSFNFSAASAHTTDTSLTPTAAAGRGGHSTPATGRRGGQLAATTASHGQGGGGTVAAGAPVQDHVIAERRRREKMNRRFIELSTVIPGLKKMDKATILGDAVKYVRELQEKVKTLQDDDSATASTTTTVNKKIKPCLVLVSDDTNAGEKSTDGAGGLPEIEVRVSDEKSVLVRIHCEKAPGILVRLLEEVEALQLTIAHTNVMPFRAATAIITITAKVEEGFNTTVEEIVRRVNSVVRQHYSANSHQNTVNRE